MLAVGLVAWGGAGLGPPGATELPLDPAELTIAVSLDPWDPAGSGGELVVP